MSADRRIPGSWQWTTLGEVTQVVGGGTPRSGEPDHWHGDVPWITPADLSGYREKTVAHGGRNITPTGLARSAARLLPTGTVLFSSRAPIGYVAIAANPMATSQGFKSFVPPKEISSSFLYYYLRSAKSVAIQSASGTTFKELSKKRAALLPFPLAPLPEQHRIVAKVESLFATLDEGVAALQRAEANLERYRTAVLKAAVEGRLTEHWRSEKRPKETGEQLLRRILAERRKRWEAEQLARFEAQGRKPPRNWKAKYKEPVAPDTNDLPGLPEGWCWASFEAICDIQLGKMLSRTAREGTENRRPYLRNSNVRWFSIDQSDIKTMAFKESELGRYAVRRGDLLVCEGGEPGRCSVYQGPDALLMYQKALHRARPHLKDVSTDFLQYCMAHQVAHGIGMPRYSETTIRHLTLEKIKAVPLPMAPAVEQRRIARGVAEQLELLIKETKRTIKVSVQGASRLRQSILKRAFDGRLVPQDPADEPASVFLERIGTEAKAERRRSKRRRPKPRRQPRSRVL